jgi:hypothetical protein
MPQIVVRNIAATHLRQASEPGERGSGQENWQKAQGRDHSAPPSKREGIAQEGFSTKIGRILVFDRRALPREIISIVRTESIEFGEEN